MFRLLGFLVGSVAALTMILLVLGIPEFHVTDREVDQQRFDAAVKKLKEKQQEVFSEQQSDRHIGTVQDSPDDTGTTVAQSPSAPAAQTAGDSIATGEPQTAEPVTVDEPPEDPELNDVQQWYSFWNPFRSEIAARGFVAQLEKVTGLDYRIVRVKTGVYEVAFAYVDDDERRTKLSRISAATGLDLPDS